MDFGIFILMQQRNKHKTSYQILHDAVEQTRVADELGFGAAWYAEHHFSNYGMCCSPLTMIAHCAAVTRKIRLGTGIVVAPLYQPARLIAEAAMVDQMSNGRLNLGIGSGYQQFEFERFGVSLETAKQRTFEILDMLEMGLQDPKFQYDGEFYQQPMSAISQRSVQKSMPPLWITSVDPAFVRRAVRNDNHVFVSGGDGGLGKLQTTRALIDGIALAEGKDPAKVPVGVLRAAFASNNQADVDRYLDCARYQRRVALSLKRRTAQIADDYQVEEAIVEGEPSLDEMRANLPVGSVDLVIERVINEIRTLKPVHYCFQTQMGDFDHGTMLKHLELWAKVIIPAVQGEIAKDPPHVAAPVPELATA